MAYSDFREKLLPESAVICAIDASSLTGPYLGSQDDSYPRAVLNRFEDVKIMSYELKYSGQVFFNGLSLHVPFLVTLDQKRLNERTTLSVEPRLAHRNRRLESVFTGTLHHQFSPRFTSEACLRIVTEPAPLKHLSPGSNWFASTTYASCRRHLW